MLGRRHEPRARQDDRVLQGPLRLGGREGSAARSGRLHDVHAGRQVRRRRQPAAAGGDAVALDDVHRERRRRRHRGEDPRRRRHRVHGPVRRLRLGPDDGRAGSDRRDLRRLAGQEHIGAQLANEPGTLLWNQCQTPDPAPRDRVLHGRLRLRGRRDRHGRRAAVPRAQGERQGHRRRTRADVGGRAAALVDHLRRRRRGRDRSPARRSSAAPC